MNFYVMINYRKIRSRSKSKENYIKLPLKEVGTLSPKKYSLIIVNDIKMDFSINLSKKKNSEIKSLKSNEVLNRLNSKKIKKESKAEIMKEKSEEIRKNNIKKENIKKTDYMSLGEMKKLSQIYTKKKVESKTPIVNRVKKATRIISAINRIKNIKTNYNNTNNNNTITYNTAYNTSNNLFNKKVSESHQQLDAENNNLLYQKIAYVRKKTLELEEKNKPSEILKTYQNTTTIIKKDKKISEKNNSQKENNLLLLSDILTPQKKDSKKIYHI